MAKIGLLIMLLFTSNNLVSQKIDASLFFIKRNFGQKNTTPLFWGVYEKQNFSCQTRVNFDWGNTFAFYPGKTFKTKNKQFFLTLESGVLLGEYWGFGPEMMTGGSFKKINYFLLLQAVKNLPSLQPVFSREITGNFFYGYNQIHYVFGKKVSGGIATQLFYSEKIKFLDAGIHFKIQPKNMYFKIWTTVDPINNYRNKVILGIGQVF